MTENSALLKTPRQKSPHPFYILFRKKGNSKKTVTFHKLTQLIERLETILCGIIKGSQYAYLTGRQKHTDEQKIKKSFTPEKLTKKRLCSENCFFESF